MLDKYKIKIIMPFFLILFIQCNNSQEQSFQQLSSAFFDWYYKIYPVIGSENGVHLYDDLLPDYNNNSMMRNIDDINRFIIELDQIDYTKLPSKKKNDYLILKGKMEQIKFNYNEIRLYESNLLVYLKKINSSIENIDYNQKKAFNHYISRLKQIPIFINNAKKNIVNKNYNKLFNNEIDNIFLNLEHKYNYFITQNISLDTLNFYNNNSIKYLTNFNIWIEEDFDDFSIKTMNAALYSKKISLLMNNEFKYLENQPYEALDRIYKKMIKIALPFFLKDHDEPIWINKKDTLDVIKFALLNNNEIIEKNFINYLNNKIPEIKKVIKENHILDINKFDENQLLLSNSYKQEYKLFNIEIPGSYENDKTVSININNFSDKWSEEKQNHYNVEYNKYYYDLKIMEKILPGDYLLNLYLSNNSIITKTFKNDVFIKGWSRYIQEVMVNNIESYNEKYKLIQYREIIKSIINYIVDYKLNTGLIDINEAKELMIDRGFYSKYHADIVIDEIVIDPGYLSLEYIGYREIKKIEKEYKKNKGKNFNLKIFNTKLIKLGYMNFKDIKDELLN